MCSACAGDYENPGEGDDLNEAVQTLHEEEKKNELRQVERQFAEIFDAENLAGSGYVRLGGLLADVKDKGLWRGEYASFEKYISELAERYRRGKTQLYNYMRCVRDLRPFVSPNDLLLMGIRKAETLRFIMKKTGYAPPLDVIVQAVNAEITTAKLRKILFDRYHIADVPEEEKGGMRWLDLGFYANEQEAEEIMRMLNAAQREAEIQGDLDNPKVIKQCLLCVAQDFSTGFGLDESTPPA